MSDALSSAARLPAAPPDAGADIETRTKQVLAEILGRETPEIAANAVLVTDLGADSLDALEIWMALEEKFDIDLDDAAVAGCKRVSDLLDLVRHAVAAKGA